jgi:endonuclease/exonuclease/phosphatase family metal-dependent hydrolase
MSLAIKEPQPAVTPEEVARLIREGLAPHFAAWNRCRSTGELLAHPEYRSAEAEVRAVMEHVATGDFSAGAAPARERYRVVAWNLERGIELDGQIEAFRTHPYLKDCDVLLLTETDLGMARSQNRDVAQELARALGMHYAFTPCYLNLTRGAGVEFYAQGENALGLHGNALLSRYPIRSARAIPLRNGIDKMAGREKRLGCQRALAAEIEFPNFRVTAVTVHLDTQSTQRHRRNQMRAILDALETAGPAILGGDWNTTTYNSSRAFYSIMGYWLRIFMGVENVIRNHFLHPDRRFERKLFALLESRGFDYRASNVEGEYTTTYDIYDPKPRQSLGEWVPGWCFAFVHWALRNHGGRCPLKIDWFATRQIRCENPRVIHDLREGRPQPLSDHDAIGLEILPPGAAATP